MEQKMNTTSNEIPKWWQEMLDHYRKTGCYRREDIEKMFGSPMGKTEVRPKGDDGPLFSLK